MIELTKYNVADDNESAFDAIGDNQKGIVLVYPPHTSTDGIKLLNTIVEKAMEANIEDDTLVVSLKQGCQIRWTQFSTACNNIKNIICFGVKPRDLSLNFEHINNQIINFNNIQFIFTDGLDEIAENQSLKKAFWTCLKNSSLT